VRGGLSIYIYMNFEVKGIVMFKINSFDQRKKNAYLSSPAS
jgi:hypothetical protein